MFNGNGKTKVESLLSELVDLNEARDTLIEQKADAINLLLTDEQREAIKAIEIELGEKLVTVDAKIGATTTEIKARMLKLKETVTAAGLQAVYSKGRLSWDSKKLQGYARAHPEIKAFATQKDPVVSIRKTK